MISFSTHLLGNSLQLVIHQDTNCSTAAVNMLYTVGSRNESPEMTGLAHLFEHLMFAGSRNVESFDDVLHSVGGTNNAYTSFDVTSYYCVTPSSNVETAFWVESDRLMYLNINQESLDVQKKVVIEEFKELYLNKPYGDAYSLLLDMAYKKHPYRWPTIGKTIEQLQSIQLSDVENFYNNFYAPNNAVLVVSGGIDKNQIIDCASKWFETIPIKSLDKQIFVSEEPQNESRVCTVLQNVPHDAIYKAFHISEKNSFGYYVCELLSFFLADGPSTKLHTALVEGKRICSSVLAFTLDTFDPGLLVLHAFVLPNIDISFANAEFDRAIEVIKNEAISHDELDKVKNCFLFDSKYSALDLLSRSDDLAIATALGNTGLVNDEFAKISAINPSEFDEVKKKCLSHTNCSTLLYKAER